MTRAEQIALACELQRLARKARSRRPGLSDMLSGAAMAVRVLADEGDALIRLLDMLEGVEAGSGLRVAATIGSFERIGGRADTPGMKTTTKVRAKATTNVVQLADRRPR